jgi:Fic family protein
VRALEEGRELAASDARSSREVLNYFAGLRYVEKHAMKKVIRHEDLFELHRILADSVMDQGTAGSYPQDIFDFVVIDECHRGGANDESNSPRG